MRQLRGLVKEYPGETKHVVNLFHVYLQMGSISLAESLLSSLPSELQPSASALLAMAKEDYPSAVEKFSSLLQQDPQNQILATNLALTHLYYANAQSGIAKLEPTIQSPISKIGSLPHSIYNLCTIYEIRDDKARQKKEAVMETAVTQYGDVCGKAHFKLDSLR